MKTLFFIGWIALWGGEFLYNPSVTASPCHHPGTCVASPSQGRLGFGAGSHVGGSSGTARELSM